MKKFSKLLAVTLFFALMIGSIPATKTFAQESPASTLYILDSNSGNIMDSQSATYQFSNNKVSIKFNNQTLNFDVQELEISNQKVAISNANYYSGQSGTLFCNMVEYNGNTCIQVLDKSQSFYQRTKDPQHNFTLVYTNDEIGNINEISNSLKQAGQLNTKNLMDAASLASMNVQTRAASREMYVFADGFSIPFFLSCGSAEGWATARSTGGSLYTVNNLRYDISYNWPSDGIGLWYDYQGSRAAYRSPAFPSSAYTTVSGSWNIDSKTGAMTAEATYSILVNKVPVFHQVYDTYFL